MYAGLLSRRKAYTLQRLLENESVIGFITRSLDRPSVFAVRLIDELKLIAGLTIEKSLQLPWQGPGGKKLRRNVYNYVHSLQGPGDLSDLHRIVRESGYGAMSARALYVVETAMLEAASSRACDSIAELLVAESLSGRDLSAEVVLAPTLWCADVIGDELALALYANEIELLRDPVYRDSDTETRSALRIASEQRHVRSAKGATGLSRLLKYPS
jgi:hypothetical protein